MLLIVLSAANVHAQTTSISNLSAPSHALVGTDVRVSLTVEYSRGYNGYWLGIAIVYQDTSDFVQGTAHASPTDCETVTGQYSNLAVCGISPLKSAGSISVTFTLKFHVPKVYQLSAFALIENSNYDAIDESVSERGFTVTVSDKLELDIHTQYPVVVTVDGVPRSPGSVFLQVYPGEHTISVPSTVEVDTGKRLRFDHWSDGSTSTSKMEDLSDDAAYTAIYVTQYRLTLVTAQGTANGDAWYDEGSSAEFSVPPAVPMSGILGMLGGKFDFEGWYEGGRSVTSSNGGSITMNTSHTLTANWAPNYTQPIIILSVVCVAAVGLAYYLSGRRSRSEVIPSTTHEKPATRQAEQAMPSGMFCIQCGAGITGDSKFCKECGAKVER